MNDQPFKVDLGALRQRPKDSSAAAVERADVAGERLGFLDREPRKRAGRRASPRTTQIHAWLLPAIAEAIAEEARRSGRTQGAVIEEAWLKYQAERD